MICKHILQIHTIKGSNSSISYNSIQHKSAKLNGSKYCNITLTIQLNLSHLLNYQTVSNYSIYRKSFVCTQFKCQTVLFDQLIGPYQVLPLRVKVDLGAMTMKGILHIPQNSNITGGQPSGSLVSYPGYSLG